MSTFQYDINPSMGDVRIAWTTPPTVDTEKALKAFRAAIRAKALNEGAISTESDTETGAIVFRFRLTKIWRDNLSDAGKVIKNLLKADEQAA